MLHLFKPITTFIFDVDGVLTNGTILLLNNGEMARQMNIKDGYALQLAIKKGYRIAIISGGTSTAVKDRFNKLGIKDVFLNVVDKKEVLEKYILKHQLLSNEVLFMGDDLPDLEPMQLVGLPCCPFDAAIEIKQISQYISPIIGGGGCVRDVIEKVLKLNQLWSLNNDIAAK
jgi:3-deoxy-D-manno-octulosonate 8-phosphate phosphatase (KDO 8-P phosphatase)